MVDRSRWMVDRGRRMWKWLRAGKKNTSTNMDTDMRQATTIAKVDESDRYILVLLRLLFVYFFRFLSLPFLLPISQVLATFPHAHCTRIPVTYPF